MLRFCVQVKNTYVTGVVNYVLLFRYLHIDINISDPGVPKMHENIYCHLV